MENIRDSYAESVHSIFLIYVKSVFWCNCSCEVELLVSCQAILSGQDTEVFISVNHTHFPIFCMFDSKTFPSSEGG